MSQSTPGLGLRAWQFGLRVDKSTGMLAATTISLFTVVNKVIITSFIGEGRVRKPDIVWPTL